MDRNDASPRGVFVTGTDTGIGKTVVCAALLRRYRSDYWPRYWKPIQTGVEQDDDTATVARLAECGPRETFDRGVRLRGPYSPHLSAAMADRRIDLEAVTGLVRDEGGKRPWIVEGAGGVLVPINETDRMADLMTRLGLPALVVARSTLGTINHVLLTIEALRRRLVPCVGVVMVGPPDAHNRAAIEDFGGVQVVGEMPIFEPLSTENLNRWAFESLDVGSGGLEDCFRD